MTRPALVWLRDDLRLDDQPAISAAAAGPAFYVYILDVETPGPRPLGGASRWWLAHSLQSLKVRIEAKGGRLDVLRGRSEPLLLDLARSAHVDRAFWTRRYGGPEIEVDKAVKASLGANGVTAQSFNGLLLREPWEVATDAGAPFKVFTPFWRRHRALGAGPEPIAAPSRLVAADWPDAAPERVDIADLALTPTKPDWSGGLAERWRPGESGAEARLAAFMSEALHGYADARDRPEGATTSQLSPHLRFGEISPRRLASAIAAAAHRGAPARATEKYLAELGWREFAYSLLYHSPDLATRAWNPRFATFPWQDDEAGFRAWSQGRTGYPLVDAGMRELWATGYMQNRVRMVAASFLIKHLVVDWRRGEQWFWDTLCDADPASNPASWQWVAGSGADAAPYFRIFNPVLQGVKFDPEGLYVKRWLPELSILPAQYIHAPWLAPKAEFSGLGYPEPIVEHGFARKRALAALATLSG